MKRLHVSMVETPAVKRQGSWVGRIGAKSGYDVDRTWSDQREPEFKAKTMAEKGARCERYKPAAKCISTCCPTSGCHAKRDKGYMVYCAVQR